MVNYIQDIEAKIAVFLSGEASPSEAMQIMEWKESSEENKATFEDLERVYALTHGQSSYSTKYSNETWSKIQEEITAEKGKVVPLFKYRQQITAIAAVLLVALLTVVLWKTTTNPEDLHSVIKPTDKFRAINNNRVLLGTANVQSFILSDKSEINLSQGSELVLARNFNSNERKLRLKGSAEFHVIHDEEKPFVVAVNDLQIIDIGTVFKVESKGDTVKISVSEGAVELRLNDQLISMVEGDSAFYLIEKEVISRYKKKRRRKNKVFFFDGTKLKDVASILSEFFEQPIDIKDEAIEDCTLTVTFRNENLITILDIIKELMDVKVVQNKKTIEIYGKGCN